MSWNIDIGGFSSHNIDIGGSFHTQCRQNNRTSSSNHDMCAHPAHIKLVTSVHDTSHISMTCRTYSQNVDMSQNVNMQKHVMSTRPTRSVIVGILACFQLCILVSASVRALKIANPDRFLVIIITTDDLKLISYMMYLFDRCVDIYILLDRNRRIGPTGRHFADFVTWQTLIPGGARIHHISSLIF